MASKADFYVGRGFGAEWIGSLIWDGLPAAMPPDLLKTPTEDAFRFRVGTLLGARPDAILPEKGWPWEWNTSHGTNYTYAYDQGRVWACCFGSSWWKGTQPEPDHVTLTRKAAKFPDMAIYRNGDVFANSNLTNSPLKENRIKKKAP